MLNINNSKIIQLSKMCSLSPQELSNIDDKVSIDNCVNWWGIAKVLIELLNLPAEDIFLDALKSQDINNIDECYYVVKWHTDNKNIQNCLNV